MPAAVADPVDATPKPTPKKPRWPLSKKKLIALALGGALLLAALGGTTLVVVIKKRAAAAQLDGGVETNVGHAAAHDERDAPPTYVPLDAFTVNLADKDAERFAQVGVTFELEDAKAVDQVKNYLPSIRNAILLVLAHKSSAELLGRPGKELLAREIGREATRAMGYDVPAEVADAASTADGAKPPLRKRIEPIGPIRRVHFSNFIIQ